MYRGKYESNVKNIPTRDRAPAPQAQAPQRASSPAPTPVAQQGNPEVPRPAPAPAPQRAAPAAPRKRRKWGPGSYLFYGFYALLLVAMIIGTGFLLNFLNGWLQDFEASQPDAKSQQLFDQLFADPDWAQIYDLMDTSTLGVASKDDFCTYMEQKVAGQTLTYSKTSAGLSGGSKYVLRLGNENLGTFTMVNQATGELDIPDWQLSNVEIFTSTEEHVTICVQQGQIVKVGDVILDDSYIIRSTSTAAEKYLPEGVHGPRTVTYFVKDLMVAPEVTVTDAAGNPVTMHYDAAAKTYQQPASAAIAISQTETDFLIDATKTYFRYMMNVSGDNQLRKYFTGNSDSIKAIRKDEWLQSYRTYSFGVPTISDYYRYNDRLYSVRMVMDLNVTRNNGTIKTFNLDTTYFVEYDGSKQGIIDLTNVDVSEVFTQVRLTCSVNGQIIYNEMLPSDTSVLKLPTVEIPQGKVFSGWFRESVDANGETTLTRVFEPDADGTVNLPNGYVLEPMDLQALFDKGGE